MNKRVIAFRILLVVFVLLLVMFGRELKHGYEDPISLSNKNVVKMLLKNHESDKGILAELNKNIKKVTVEDKETAINIAEMVFEQVYEKSKNDNKPFKVEYYDEYNVWLVMGTLKSDQIGGVPYVIIRKSDSKILGVMHTK